MPLLTESPPAGIDKVLRDTVSELVGHGTLAIGLRAKTAVSTPVRVYNLGADAIAAGKGLAAAKPTGWLSTLVTDGEVRGTIELVAQRGRKGASAEGLRFGGFTSGPLQRELAASVARARESASRAEVHLAVLRVPALYLLALWLRGDNGDRLVPVPPCPPALKPGEHYVAERALAMLAESARDVAKAEDARN
ncbi:MAG TPA: hypothetical protein PLE54_07675 [Burkholderiaceae bacterium]|nr:hypothetical protein [Burkholderiaceae bacterium]